MAQTTGALSGRAIKVEYSTNSSDFTDMSGHSASIEVSGGDRMSGEAYTFDGDTAIVAIGKREPLEIEGNAVYTISSADPFRVLEALYVAGTPLKVRWIFTSSATTADWRFTSATGYLTNVAYPGGEAEPGDPIMFGWTLKTPSISSAVVA